MFSFFRKKEEKRLLFNIDNVIGWQNVELVFDLYDCMNFFIKEINKFPFEGKSNIQLKLRKDKEFLELFKAEILLLMFQFFVSKRSQRKLNKDTLDLIFNSIITYIDSGKLKFPTKDYDSIGNLLIDRLQIAPAVINQLTERIELGMNSFQYILHRTPRKISLEEIHPIAFPFMGEFILDLDSHVALAQFLNNSFLQSLEALGSFLKQD